MTTIGHAHRFIAPPANGPFAVAVCACGASERRMNAFSGDYTEGELAKMLGAAPTKRAPQTGKSTRYVWLD